MKDVIYRDDAIKAINKVLDRETLLNRLVRKIVLDAIISIPSADRPSIEVKADEVLTKIYDAVNGINEMVHEVNRPSGEWIHDYHFGLALPEHKCSVCGEWEYSDTESNYCPCCGCRMKGVDDEC